MRHNRRTTVAALLAALAASLQITDLPAPWRAVTTIAFVLAIAALGIFAADAPPPDSPPPPALPPTPSPSPKKDDETK